MARIGNESFIKYQLPQAPGRMQTMAYPEGGDVKPPDVRTMAFPEGGDRTFGWEGGDQLPPNRTMAFPEGGDRFPRPPHHGCPCPPHHEFPRPPHHGFPHRPHHGHGHHQMPPMHRIADLLRKLADLFRHF